MYGPWAMFISREKKPKSRQIPPTPTMDMLGVHCSDPPLPDEFEDLIRSSSDPQMHPQRRWHCFFQAFLTSLRISYDPQAILKCILKGGCTGFSKHFWRVWGSSNASSKTFTLFFPTISDEFEDLIRSSSDPQMHPQRRLHCFSKHFWRVWGSETWELYNTKGLSLGDCSPPPLSLSSPDIMNPRILVRPSFPSLVCASSPN